MRNWGLEKLLLALYRYNLKDLKFTSRSDSKPHDLRNSKKAIHEGRIWKIVTLNRKGKKCHDPEAKSHNQDKTPLLVL